MVRRPAGLWARHVAVSPPPQKAPPQPEGGDLFGGHGLFEDLRPIGLALAVCGLLPVSLRPVRFCFNPLRSTLAYIVVTSVVVVWSCWRLCADRLPFLDSGRRASMYARFMAVICLGAVTGLVLVPLLWAEARHLRQHQPAAARLMSQFGRQYHAHPLPWARRVSWAAVLFLAVFLPVCELLWLLWVASEGGSWTHMFAYNHALAMPAILCSMVAGSACCVRRFATALRVTLVEELSGPWQSPRRLEALRAAWLDLRDVTQGLVRTPISLLAMFVYMLLMTTLATYQALVSLMEGQTGLALVLLCLGSQFYVMLLLLCDSVQRAVQAVSQDFLHPLETFECQRITEPAKIEVTLLREVIASSRLEVTAAGYCRVSRSTLTSVLSATISYIIVLVQFRQPEYKVEHYRDHSAQAVPGGSGAPAPAEGAQ